MKTIPAAAMVELDADGLAEEHQSLASGAGTPRHGAALASITAGMSVMSCRVRNRSSSRPAGETQNSARAGLSTC